jgi:hypothetical protein
MLADRRMTMQTLKESHGIEKWSIFELSLKGPESGNPFIDVSVSASFKYKNRELHVEGFYDGKGIYKLRFMPDTEGQWTYRTSSNCGELNGIEGQLMCCGASSKNHGPVRVVNTYHFAYEDGTPYFPVGTTCYVWNHQGDLLEEETLKSLKASPFNKIRMCVFPKHYLHNFNEPVYYPFEGSVKEGWDYTRLNPEFFRHLEDRIKDLLLLGIEADLILFHAYDRWGFSNMGAEADDRYLRYIVARLAAFRNIWWSFANEYDFLPERTTADWERYTRIVVESDPYQHLKSIHNSGLVRPYDPSCPWITHCSIQGQEIYKTTEYTAKWRNLYKKPVVVDECSYEGNIEPVWGNISGQEMVRRFWEGTVRGGYVSHGETYTNSEDILWWSRGGKLCGSSPERIGFLKRVLEEGPGEGINPIQESAWDSPCGGVPGEYYLYYFGFNQPSYRNFILPEGKSFKVDILDTWNMTITGLEGTFDGEFRIDLPGKQYIAVRIRRVRDGE